MLEFRTINGLGNNIDNPTLGEADTELIRLLPPAYYDGISQPRAFGSNNVPLPNPRDISNVISDQEGLIPNSLNVTDWIWQWGQFIDHDLDLTEPTADSEEFPIPVQPTIFDTGEPDPIFENEFDSLPFRRNDPAPGTGTDTDNPREHINELTAFIDGSQVYGSEEERAELLRTNDGTGMLLTSTGDNGEILLPLNTLGLSNANPLGLPAEELFVAGDIRSSEQVGLAAVHTLFVREHNYWAEEIADLLDSGDPTLTGLFDDSGLEEGEFIYKVAREIVGAEIQQITYNEYLPILLGEGGLSEFVGYDPTVDPSVSNEFSTASFRLGHTQLSPDLQLVDADGNSTGSIALREAFFNTDFVVENGVDSLLAGLASQTAQELDAFVIDDVRDFLFAADSGGLDLVAVNIQRGRDHGIPAYNDAREGLGLERLTSFDEISSNPEVVERFETIYDSVDDVDFWIGGIAEDPVNGGLVGELLHTVISDQFTRARDGDRLFYLNNPLLVEIVEGTTLSDIIERNTLITDIQDNVFSLDVDVNVNKLIGGSDDDELTGDTGSDKILGGFGDDTLIGEAGSDKLLGGYGDDSVDGGDGNDTLNGGFGSDELLGGSGADELLASYGDDLVQGGDGDDIVLGETGDDIVLGNSGDDIVVGGYGDDDVFGNDGDDDVFGNDGDDLVRGGDGDDIVYGGDGDDIVYGGDGDDIVEGGDGDDLFLLALGDGEDIIVDFEDGEDILGLTDGLSFDGLIIESIENGDTLISIDGENVATLMGVDSTLLEATDFVAV